MSVRKRTWVTTAGKSNEAWVVDYVDQVGKRHLRTFDKKKVADAFHDTVRTEVRDGIHTADRESITVAEAGKLWLATGDQYGLERSTIAEYRRILDRYIIPAPPSAPGKGGRLGSPPNRERNGVRRRHGSCFSQFPQRIWQASARMNGPSLTLGSPLVRFWRWCRPS
jgi:hypothetical protein